MALENRLLEEIRNFFNNDFAINLSNLQKPTYIFVRDFHCRALIEFEVDTDNIRKASPFLEGMDNSVEITGDLNLVAAINYTFHFLQFGLFDLLSPGENQKRTVTMISNVMEFMNMADELTTNLDFEGYKACREEITKYSDQLEDTRHKLSQLALTKDSIIQNTIEIKKELSETKLREQQMCDEGEGALKTMYVTKRELERKREILKSKKAEIDKLKSSIGTLKEELVGVQSLEVKEEAKKKAEQMKEKLHAIYLEKVAARKKYEATLGAMKPVAAVAENVFELVEEDGTRQNSLLLMQKETADSSQTQLVRKKELTTLQNEVVELEKKLTNIKSAKTCIMEEYSNVKELSTEESSELIKSIDTLKDKIGKSDEDLDTLKNESARDDDAVMMSKEKFKKLLLSFTY